MNFNSSTSPGWTLQVACLSFCVCCAAVGESVCLSLCVSLAYIQMSLSCRIVNRWSCQSVWCSSKRGRKWLFPFFSNHSAAAWARYEMTAIIKLTQSERQALLSPQTHTHTHTHAHTHTHTHTHTQTSAFTSLHWSWQGKSRTHGANKTCCGDWIRFVSAGRGVWHLYLITDPWCVSAGFCLHYRALFLSTNLIRPDQTGPAWGQTPFSPNSHRLFLFVVFCFWPKN